MNLGAPLADQNIAGSYYLAVISFDAQTLGLAVSAVFGASYAFLCANICKSILNKISTSLKYLNILRVRILQVTQPASMVDK
jgi:hypothetical protein